MIAAQSLQYALAYLALVLVSAGFQNAITAQNAAVADGIARSAGQSLSIGFRLLPRTVLLGILLVLGFMLIAICFAIPGYFVEHSSRVLLVALYCVPLCFYLGRVFLANAIFVVEDLGAYASLLRSWQLTKNNYWRTAAVLAVLLSIFAVLVIVLALLTGFISAALGAASPVSVAVVQLIQAVGNTLFTPFISAILLSIYYDLRLRNGNLTYTGTQEGAEASQGHDR